MHKRLAVAVGLVVALVIPFVVLAQSLVYRVHVPTVITSQIEPTSPPATPTSTDVAPTPTDDIPEPGEPTWTVVVPTDLPTETPTPLPTVTPTARATNTPTPLPTLAPPTPTRTPVPPTATRVPPTATPTTPPSPAECAATDPGVAPGLTAWMDDATPEQYSYVTTCVRLVVNGQLIAGVPVKITVRFKSEPSVYTGTTGPDGVVAIEYYISRATLGYTVAVDAEAPYNGTTYRARTQFTPQ